MQKKNVVPVVSEKLTVKESRLVKKMIQKAKRFRTDAQKLKFLKAVLKNQVSKKRLVIVMTAITVKVIKAKLGMPKAQWDFLASSVAMQKAIFTNTLGFFTPVFGGLAAWATQNTALSAALVVLKNRGTGGKGMKSTAMTALKPTLNQALAYVNGICALNQPNALTVIEAAMMVAINPGPRTVKPITVKVLADAGTVRVGCPSTYIGPKKVAGTYEKGWSSDGGRTWNPLPSIPKCKLIATGLISGVPVIFRSRTITTIGGTSAWVISLPVTPN